MKKKIFVMAAVLLAAGLSFVGYLLFAHSAQDALTVSELRSQGPSLSGRQVAVKGQVSPGTINWDNQARALSFDLKDSQDSLSVVYQGVAPDEFKPGAELVVEGSFSPDGVFVASRFGQPRSLCNLCH